MMTTGWVRILMVALLLAGAAPWGAPALVGAQERETDCLCVDRDGQELEDCICVRMPDVERIVMDARASGWDAEQFGERMREFGHQMRSFRAPQPPDAPDAPDAPGAPMPPGASHFRFDRPDVDGLRSFGMVGAFGSGLELVRVGPELGSYFGTERGVLVAAVSEESALGLQAGDVILEIGDRTVEDPARVRSILATYGDDESVTFRIRRDGREMDVSGRIG